MKKPTVSILAALLCMAFTEQTRAVDFDFNGDWRTRAYMMRNFTGEDRTGERDCRWVDTRTQLQLNAAVNDNLRLINQFEMEAVWGYSNYGEIDTDGETILIQHSYADFTMDALNVKVGAQPVTLARGFLLNCDFAGLNLTYTADTMDTSFIWVKHMEGGIGKGRNDFDSDYYIVAPRITLGDMSASPYFMSVKSKKHDYGLDTDIEDFAVFYLGVDVDARLDVLTAWATAVYQTGALTPEGGGKVDVDGWIVAMGGEFGISNLLGVHGQFFAASGQDPKKDKRTAFRNPEVASYFWAEIMGYGIFDYGRLEGTGASSGSPADQISNIMAFNAGGVINPMDRLTVRYDFWYARLMEKDINGVRDLGVEINVAATYELMENLHMDIVGAYLFAGDATTMESPDSADPIEIGLQLRMRF